jgi:hypothetical protein
VLLGCRGARPHERFHLGLYSLELLHHALDGAQELLDALHTLDWVLLPVDCVPGHAAMMIITYPRGSASGTVWGFVPAPHWPSRAKVLRAGPGVIPGRAYVFAFHLGLVRRRERTMCIWSCPGAVPPGWRLFLQLAHSGCTVPRALSAFWAGVTRLADACPFLPVVGHLLQHIVVVVLVVGGGHDPRGTLLTQLQRLLPIVELQPHRGAHLVPHLSA